MKAIILVILTLALSACATTMHRGNAVRDRLSDTPGLTTHNITIDEGTPGVITLNGRVSSARDRETIERVARSTNGVKEVRNNLVVESSSVAVREEPYREGYSSSSSSDQRSRELASDIMSQISSSPDIRNYNLNVGVVGSEVVLRGEVGSERERSEAERIARNTRGVTSVRNEIILADSRSSDFQISQNVREALRGRTDLDLRNVDIFTRDAVVTLRGYQYSNRDIDNLVSSTRSVRGVRDVRNELTLNNRDYNDPYRRR